jgi:hypothetical protein
MADVLGDDTIFEGFLFSSMQGYGIDFEDIDQAF